MADFLGFLVGIPGAIIVAALLKANGVETEWAIVGFLACLGLGLLIIKEGG